MKKDSEIKQENIEVKYTFCRICEALCGLEVDVCNDRIKAIRPNFNHITTEGFSCIKGLRQHELYSQPDRLKYPLKKTENGYKRISWSQALKEIGQKVKIIRKQYSANSLGMYIGTAAGFSVLHPAFAQGFMTGIGSSSIYSSATQDCSNKFAVSKYMYGHPFTLTFPDLQHTECLIVVGANPVVSKWSFLQVPNSGKRLKEIEERGGTVYIIDPRKTETAKIVGKHIFIRPGTDVFFYLSFLQYLLSIKNMDAQRIRKYMEGFNTVAAIAKPWSPERTELVTGIPSKVLKEMVLTYAKSEKATLYCSTGVNMGGNGVLAFWLQEVINAISGNLDKQGGSLIGKGIIDFPKFGVKKGVLMKENYSRVGNFRSVNDTFPGGILADEILTPGDKQIRGMFVTGGNPLITMANSTKLKKAFESLDLLVCLDIQMSETCSIADYILPCTDPTQRPDLPFIFPLMLGLQQTPYLQATKAIIKPEAEQRDEASIYLDLAKACGVSIFNSYVAQQTFKLTMWYHSFIKSKKIKSIPQESFLNSLLRLCGQSSFKNLLKYPNGKLRKPHESESFLGQRVYTKNGLVNLAPKEIIEEAKHLEILFDQISKNMGTLSLITKRDVTTHNSWTHNHERFISGSRHTNYLYVNPLDAKKHELQNNDLVEVKSESGIVRVPIRISGDLMPGTVALPHGWGHQDSGLEKAKKTTGVNVNILAADGSAKIEKISGMSHLTGILVEIKKSPSPQTHTWSGM